MRADSAVEPTKSENITVTWRRSARSSGEALGVAGAVAASAEGSLAPASLRRAAMASSSFSRCPTAATPSSFSVSCVRLGRTVSSISCSRNAASYFPRPRLRSQTTTSMMKAQAHGCPASWCPPRGVSSWGAVQSGLGPHRTPGSTTAAHSARSACRLLATLKRQATYPIEPGAPRSFRHNASSAWFGANLSRSATARTLSAWFSAAC